MLTTERNLLWQTMAICLGLALPAALLGKGIMYTFLIIAIITGLLATRGASIRSTLNLLIQSNLVRMLLVLFVWLGISAYFGKDAAYSLHKASQVWGIGLLAACLFLSLREIPGKYLNILQISLISGLIFMMAMSLLDSFSGSLRLSEALHGADKALTQHRQNYFSIIFALLAPFLWAYYARKLQEGSIPLVKMSAPIIVPLSIAIVFLAGGRAGCLALLVALVIFLGFGTQRYRLAIKAPQWLVLFGSILAGTCGYALSRGWDSLSARLEITPLAGDLVGGSGRLDIWQNAINMVPWDVTHSQFWLGLGPNAFRLFPQGSALHPHNALIQLQLEIGFIGVILASIVALMLLNMMWRYAQGNIFGLAGLASLCAFFTMALLSKSIFDVEWLTVFVTVTLLAWRLGWNRGTTPPQGSVLNAASFIQTPQSGK